MFSPQYEAQTELLIHCIPEVAKHPCFALKGGTAINLFLRDMPRVSVDIDLTYLPLKPRDESLREIEQTLLRMKLDIERKPNSQICHLSIPTKYLTFPTMGYTVRPCL